MEDFFLTIKELLIKKNFFLVIRGLDNTLLLLIRIKYEIIYNG